MKAAIVDRYGPPEVVEIREVPKPVPGDNEILVRTRASTVNSGDARVRALRVPGGMGILMRLALGFNGPKTKILGSRRLEMSRRSDAMSRGSNRAIE